MSDLLNEDTMIYNTEDGNTSAGGFSIESLLLNQGMPALYKGTNSTGGSKSNDKVSDRFKHLAVPAGLLYMSESVNRSSDLNVINDSNVINDDLYEKLLKLAEHDVKEMPNKSKHPKKTKKRSTKNNKKKTKRKY